MLTTEPTYEIVIDEEQRRMLLRAVKFLLKSTRAYTREDHEEREEYEILRDMLCCMPKVQAENPDGIVHGFCY